MMQLACLLLTALELTLQDFFILKDYKHVATLAEQHLNSTTYPYYIKALAHLGEEEKMRKAWEAFFRLDQDKALDRELVESVAWGVIWKGSQNSSPLIQLIAMLAATFSQDIFGVHLLIEKMESKNSLIRALAVELATKMGGANFHAPISKLYKKETVYEVRLRLIQAIGALGIHSMKPALEELLESGSITYEERLVAMESYIRLQDKITRFEVLELLQSEKFAMRMVGLQAALLTDDTLPLEPFLQLLKDPQSQVRTQTLRTAGLLFGDEVEQKQKLEQLIEKAKQDKSFEVQLMRTWLSSLVHPDLPKEAWLSFLLHEKRPLRLIASALIGTLGTKTLAVQKEGFLRSKDPFVKTNLALGLLKQQKEIEPSVAWLAKMLDQKEPLWMTKEAFGLELFAPTEAHFLPMQASQKDLHRLTQLKLLQVIALFDQELAERKLEKFLEERNWSITGVALALLLTECRQEAASALFSLVEKEGFKHKVEASIVLSLWSRDPKVLALLEETYKESDRKKKEMILEAIGKVGTITSIPFLLECLQEPYPLHKLIVAASLIQCLNH